MPKELSLEDLTKAELILYIRAKSRMNLIKQEDLLYARWDYLTQKSAQIAEEARQERDAAFKNKDREAIMKSFLKDERADKIWDKAEKIYAQMELLRSN